jgi:hypothetical protein
MIMDTETAIRELDPTIEQIKEKEYLSLEKKH